MPEWDQGGESGQAHDQSFDRRGMRLPKGANTKGLDAVVDAGFAYQKNPTQKNWDTYEAAFSKLTPEQKAAIRPGGSGGSRGGGTNGTGGSMKGSPPGVNW